MSYSYKKFENTPLWNVINKGVMDLVENNDIEETTNREYIVGYLCKLISESESLVSLNSKRYGRTIKEDKFDKGIDEDIKRGREL